MSGHNKWSTIKRKKGVADAKRGQIFTRLTRELVMAAREGGGDPEMNFQLRLAVDKARAQNMPKENIERAIKRGTGDAKDGVSFEQVTYEGYAPHGVAVIIECMTENRNRTVAEVRHILSRSGGNLGESGSVAWQFTRQAYFSIPSKGNDFDRIFEIALDGGADDVTDDGDSIEIIAPVEKFKILNDKLREAQVEIEEGTLRMSPNQEMELSVEATLQVMRTLDSLEEMDDIQNVYSNLNISEEALAALEEE